MQCPPGRAVSGSLSFSLRTRKNVRNKCVSIYRHKNTHLLNNTTTPPTVGGMGGEKANCRFPTPKWISVSVMFWTNAHRGPSWNCASQSDARYNSPHQCLGTGNGSQTPKNHSLPPTTKSPQKLSLTHQPPILALMYIQIIGAWKKTREPKPRLVHAWN